MTFNRSEKMSQVPLVVACAGAVLVFLGGASTAFTGEVGVKEYVGIVGGALIILASMYIYSRMLDF